MRSTGALLLSLTILAGTAEAARPNIDLSRFKRRPKDSAEVMKLADQMVSNGHGRYEAKQLTAYYGTNVANLQAAKDRLRWLDTKAKRAQTRRTVRNWSIGGTITAAVLTGAVMYGMSGHQTGEATARVPTGNGTTASVTLEGTVRPYLPDGERLVIRHDDGRVENVELHWGEGRESVAGVTFTNNGNTIQFLVGGQGFSGDKLQVYSIDRKPDGTWGSPKGLGKVSVAGNVPAINTTNNFSFVRE